MILLIIYLLLPLNIVISTTNIPKYETTTQIPTESDALSNFKNDIDNSRRNRRNTQPEVGTNLYLSQADTAPVRRAYQFPPKGLIQMLLNRNSLIDQSKYSIAKDKSMSKSNARNVFLNKRHEAELQCQRGPFAEEFSGIRVWNSLNLSGRRELPLYVEEPIYNVISREVEYPQQMLDTSTDSIKTDPFIPPRGRKDSISYNNNQQNDYTDLTKYNNEIRSALQLSPQQRLSVSQILKKKRTKHNDILNSDDFFFPNRGKKNNMNTNLFGNDDDLFFPNRGKKMFYSNGENDLFYPNRGKKMQFDDGSNDGSSKQKRGGSFNDLMNDELFFPNRGKREAVRGGSTAKIYRAGSVRPRPTPFTSRKITSSKRKNKREIGDLLKDTDTFYSPRGRRTNNNVGSKQSQKYSQYDTKSKLLESSGDTFKKVPTKYSMSEDYRDADDNKQSNYIDWSSVISNHPLLDPHGFDIRYSPELPIIIDY